MAFAAYRALAACAGALTPVAAAFAPPGVRASLYERLGHVSRPGGCDAWIHAASMGEALAVAPLVAALRARAADARFHLTATTATGRARLERLGEPVSLAPLDAPQAARRFLAGTAPKRLLLVETELWPHWLMACAAARVPVAVVSARLSERSVSGYRRLGRGLGRLIEGLDGVLAQSEEDAARWRALGARADRTAVVGNLKTDALPRGAADRGAARAALGLDPQRPLLVLGSLRPGEAALMASAWAALDPSARARWQVAVVPRHADATRGLRAEAAGVKGEGADAIAAWRWDDRPGVLAGYYAAADAAFVGGSLLPYGGHNPLEPAACGAAVVMGPHHASQLPAMQALRAAGGIVLVDDGAGLADTLASVIGDDAGRSALAARARATVERLRGATARTLDRLEGWGLWPA